MMFLPRTLMEGNAYIRERKNVAALAAKMEKRG